MSVATEEKKPIRCRDCNGRGHWNDEVHHPDGSYEVVSHFCETCNGTGILPDPNGEAFDFGGDLLDEDD